MILIWYYSDDENDELNYNPQWYNIYIYYKITYYIKYKKLININNK